MAKECVQVLSKVVKDKPNPDWLRLRVDDGQETTGMVNTR